MLAQQIRMLIGTLDSRGRRLPAQAARQTITTAALPSHES